MYQEEEGKTHGSGGNKNPRHPDGTSICKEIKATSEKIGIVAEFAWGLHIVNKDMSEWVMTIWKNIKEKLNHLLTTNGQTIT